MTALQLYSGRQRGAVLLIGLVMLIMVTLLAISGFNMVKVNQQVTGNMESRAQALVAANAALEEAISSTLFVTNPSSMLLSPCGSPNRRCYDVNGDGGDDIEVVLAPPVCQVLRPLRLNELELPEQSSCLTQDSEFSMCAESVWELRATALDRVTGASAEVRQGVALMVRVNDADTACPN